ncbi:MAG: ribonuclease III [Clostridia bacterium]|nr:ribonuclease III [Clostridia bacterium]
MMENNELLRTADGATLAFLGDAVYELWVRRRLVCGGMCGSKALNDASHRFVTAKAQAAAFHRIEHLLTAEEIDCFKRGRNSPHLSVPKSSTGAEYRTATGFEALCAALCLCGRNDRVDELLTAAFAAEERD